MTQSIGLQITGRAPGFKELLNVNWSGRQLRDDPYRSSYAADEIFFVTLGAEYTTYCVAVTKFICNIGDDRRESLIKFGLRIPVGHVIDDRNGDEVSPVDILRQVKEKFKRDHLTLSYGRYTYRGDAIPQPVVAEYATMLDGLDLRQLWGKRVTMCGSTAVHIAANDANIRRIIDCLSLCKRMADYAFAEVGEFTPGTQLTTLTDAEIYAEPAVTAKVMRKDGTCEEHLLPETNAMIFSSVGYGFDGKAYQCATITISRDQVLEAFRKGQNVIEGDLASAHLLPSDGAVEIRFNPSPRVKDYTIVCHGPDSKNAFQWLRYNGSALTEMKIRISGEQIISFEEMVERNPEYLQRCFTYSGEDYELTGATLRGSIISLQFKKIKKPEPAPKPKAGEAGQEDSNLYHIKVILPPKSTIPSTTTISLYCHNELVATIGDRRFEMVNDYLTLECDIVLDRIYTQLVARVGAPALYEGESAYDANSKTYVFKCQKVNLWERICDATLPRDTDSGLYGLRFGIYLFFFLLIFFGGMTIGCTQSENISDSMSGISSWVSGIFGDTKVAEPLEPNGGKAVAPPEDHTPAPADTVAADPAKIVKDPAPNDTLK